MNDDRLPTPPSAPTATPVTVGEAVEAAKHGQLRAFLNARLDPKAYLGLHFTVGLAIAVAAISMFSAVLDALLDNSIMVKMDIATDAFIHAHMTPSLLSIVSATTQFGGPIAMTSLAIGGAIVLWVTKRKVVFIGWIAAFGGATVIGEVLKRAVHRTRPTYGALFQTDPFSFPSGHAMASMIGYGMLLWVLFRFWHPRRAVKALVYVLAGLLMIAIGLSRIFLGVHYPSDVAGGWAAALAWLAVCITGVHVAQHRHAERVLPVGAAMVAAATASQKGSANPAR